MKIFRDEIYGGLRFVFQEDHLYYKRHGIYDFPQKKRLMLALMSAMTLLSRIPFFRKKIQAGMVKMMTMPYRKVLAAAGPAEPAAASWAERLPSGRPDEPAHIAADRMDH
jgi:hypothetical protein